MNPQQFSPGRLLAFLVLFATLSLSVRAQSFSYASPICLNTPMLSPNFSMGFPPGGFFSSAPGLDLTSSTGQINPGASAPGTYTIAYSGCPSGCPIITVITIHSLTPISISNLTVCSSAPPPLTAIANPSTGLTYTWFPSGSTNYFVNLFPPYAGQTLTLTVLDANGCRNTTSSVISVVTSPTPVIGSSSNSICAGASVTLGIGTGSNPVWSTGATSYSIVQAPAFTSTYQVTVSNAQGCTGSSPIKTITVNSLSLSVSNLTLCAGKNATLTANALPNTGGVNYTWLPGPLSGSVIVVSPTVSTNYTLTGNRSGCTATTVAQVQVSPSFTPITKFSYQFPLCTKDAGATPSLVPGFTAGGSFSVLAGAVLALNDTTGYVDFTNIAPSEYYISYNVPAIGCTLATSYVATLTVGQSSTVQLVPEIIMLKGETVGLTASGGTYYSWSPNLFIDCTVCDTPHVSPPESMQYCVTSDLCIDAGCVNVTVICKNEGDFSLPNAFTPDGDGNNDKFCLQGWDQCHKKFEVLIFDRWGTKVYQSDKPDFCWDGKYNGEFLNAGVYTYAITATYDLIPQMMKRGNITIIR